MSLLIKGMEMPKSESVVTVKIYGDGRVIQTREQRPGLVITGMNALVGEAVELPPHGRLGDLDKLEKMFADIDNAPYSEFDGEEPFYSAEDAAQIIRLAPTIIPADEEET